jgi:hypothetical protein
MQYQGQRFSPQYFSISWVQLTNPAQVAPAMMGYESGNQHNIEIRHRISLH